MIPCLHQSNDRIKRKLRVWRLRKRSSLIGAKSALTCARQGTCVMENLKCNRFLGAIKALDVTALQITRFRPPPYKADNGNFGNFETFDHHGTVFAPKQSLHQKVAVGMENLKM